MAIGYTINPTWMMSQIYDNLTSALSDAHTRLQMKSARLSD
jgi:hypothetical protein